MKEFYTYILASKKNGTLYIGVISDVIKRIWENKNNVTESFTQRYSIHTLVYYEIHSDFDTAVTREKKLKNWIRAWKIKLIEKTNPHWNDLYEDLL